MRILTTFIIMNMLAITTSLLQVLLPADHGHFYKETDPSRFIVEPWNAFSSLTFLIPAFIFFWQLRGRYADFKFIVYFCCPLLILGGFGSTFFHAFRSSVYLILMDVVPIVVLVLGVSIWMWLKVLKRKWWIWPILIVFFGLTFLSMAFLEGQNAVSAGYFVRGFMLLLPCVLFLRQSALRHASTLFVAMIWLILALVFRFTDDKIEIGFMPWGTHWLWHVSTAFGAYYLGKYLISNAYWKVEK